MSPKSDDYTKWSDEELQAEQAKLAEAKHAIRLQQNAVAGEIGLREAFKNMSGETRQALLIRLGGEVGADGKSEAEKQTGADQ